MVQLKKKVTLKTKIADSDIKQDMHLKGAGSSEPANNSGGGKKRNLLTFLGIIVLTLILFLVFVGKDNKSSTNTDTGKNDVSAKVDFIKTIKSDDITTEKVDSISVAKKDNTLKEDPATASAEKTSIDNKSKQVSNIEVANDKEKSQISSSRPLDGSLEQKAIAVIRGTYGNGLERKQKLGDEYTLIQNKVNEMYRDGLVD